MQRALILFQQSRYDLAEQEVRRELAIDPQNPMGHALLSLCLVESKRYKEATEEAEEAIRQAPDLPLPHYAMATALHHRNRLDEAQRAIEEAIRLDPADADHFAVLAAIWHDRRDWNKALTAAEHGMAIDSEHVGCTNLRAMALVKLGRHDEAGATIDSALAKDPEDAVTHANQGWALLHRAEYGQALVHFREALRLDPELDWARAGIVEALKAKHFFYSLMLRYFLWISGLSSRLQWIVIIGFFFGNRLLKGIAASKPELAPLITPVLIVYVVFALSTWLADPLFNLVLRLNRFGRYALSKEQTVTSNFVGGAILAAVLSIVAWLATGDGAFILFGLLFGLLTVLIAGTFRCHVGWPRNVMGAYTALVALAGLSGLGMDMAGSESSLGLALFTVSMVGIFIGSIVANVLVAVRPKR